MSKLKTSLHTLFDSPWFSSLWTLQEAFIGGNTSLLASREAIIQDATYGLLNIGSVLEDILTYCASLKFEEEASIDERDADDLLHTLTTECCSAIRKSGMVELSALHIIALYLAAKHRTASKEEDYIYGIQQCFEVRLGNTAEGSDPSRTFSRDDLELQLAAQMFKLCPVQSQMHIYTAPVAPGSGFYPRMSSELPEWIPDVFTSRRIMYNFESECHLSILNAEKMTLGHFRGLQIPFQSLYQEWERINTAQGLTPTTSSGSSVRSIFYFGIDGAGSSASPAFRLPDHVDPNQAIILFLGRAWLDLPNTREEAEEFGVGILSLRGKEKYGSHTFFRRLGFCLWKVRSQQLGRAVLPRNMLNPSVNEDGWCACETCFG